MTKRASSKPASSPTPNTARCRRMISRASTRCSKLQRACGPGTGNTSEKVSLTMPTIAGTCVTLESQSGRSCWRTNSTRQVRPYSTQESPLLRSAGSTITSPR